MEDWSKGFFETVEMAVCEVEKAFTEMGKDFEQMVDELTKFSEEITEEVNNKILPDLEQYFNEFVEPILDVYFDLELEINESEFEPFVTYVHPTSYEHPACRGCQNYHGHVYGGNLLVCAMHPNGVEDETCPDWESQ
ncbi:MAG: hypothetical protein SWJ54_02990 [Cyanobacteriota bacterium]|nr:hypothetical protein [Cyanobacteriota bacterium]